MNFSLAPQQVLQWTQWLLALALLLQALEYGALAIHTYKPYTSKKIKVMALLRLILSVTLLFYISLELVIALLVIVWWTTQIYKGRFNGGSDSMTATLLVGLLFYCWSPDDESYIKMALWWIALQSVLSYWISGWIKIKDSHWRKGSALIFFSLVEGYNPNPFLKQLKKAPTLSLVLCWLTIIFELSAPLVLFSKTFALMFVSIGILFHFIIFLAFGLNRFFWIWISTYPALLFCQWPY